MEYWYMFPICVTVATVAIAAAIEGAAIFTPFFLLVVGLPAEVAIGTGLVTQTVGFLSGLAAHARRGFIDYRLGRSLLWIAAPAGFLGSWLTAWVPAVMLKMALSAALMLAAVSLLRPAKIVSEPLPSDNLNQGRMLGACGGLLLGMVSMGLGGLMTWFLLRRRRLLPAAAVGTTVLVVAITAVAASVGHGYHFLAAGRVTQIEVLGIVVFSVPGVILGAQIGPMVTARLSQRTLEVALGGLLAAVAAITVITA